MALIQNFLRKTAVFFEMIKFEHTLFALPFAYMGLWLAEEGWPRLHLFFWVTAAMVSFRTLAMALNRLIDTKIDRLNPRTNDRALPQGRLKPFFVAEIALASLCLFELSAYRLGLLCFYLSPVPVFLAWLYPWTKRFTWLSHAVLGIILGIAPYGAWLASRSEWSWVPAMLFLGITLWVAGFDMIYALQDLQFDRENGLFSFPAFFGEKTTLFVTHILHIFALLAWLAAGWLAGRGFIYALGILSGAAFLIRENWLIRSFGIKKIGEAFFVMNAVVSCTLFFATVGDLTWGALFS